jgi:hypothetical protein
VASFKNSHVGGTVTSIVLPFFTGNSPPPLVHSGLKAGQRYPQPNLRRFAHSRTKPTRDRCRPAFGAKEIRLLCVPCPITLRPLYTGIASSTLEASTPSRQQILPTPYPADSSLTPTCTLSGSTHVTDAVHDLKGYSRPHFKCFC